MPSCPNCGRDTMRTEDWVCQWCGYPLLSKAYKKIDKTFKQLQAERSSTGGYIEPELETEVSVETKPEPAPEPPPIAPEPEAEVEPVSVPKSEPAPAAELVAEEKTEPIPEPAPSPEPEPVAEEKTEPVIELPPPAPAPALEPVAEEKPEPSPSTPEPEEEVAPEPVPAPQLVAEERPEPAPEPPPVPEPTPPPAVPDELTVTKNGVVTSVVALNHFYQTDRADTHSKLKEQNIRITGQVEKVFVRDHLDIRYIVLTAEPKAGPWSVRCSFEKEAVSELNRLSTGQTVTVQGIYDGYGKNIIIKECTLVA